jgi:hypothetical protein
MEVSYTFRARLEDTRPGAPYDQCDHGVDTTITIYVNPTPVFNVTVEDTIVCDSSSVILDITDLTVNASGPRVYDVERVYNTDSLIVNPNPGNETNLDIDTDITDSFINLSRRVQPVQYRLTLRINDTRSPLSFGTCDHGVDTIITIYVNPTPVFNVNITDTLVCDSSMVNITVSDLMGDVEGNKVYDLNVVPSAGINAGLLSPDGTYILGTDNISDQAVNLTSEIQTITYNFTARLEDDRPGSPYGDCDHGVDTSITVYVNPTPDFDVSISDT